MKFNKIILFGIFLLSFNCLLAQTEKEQHSNFKLHKIKIKTMDNHKIKGFLESFDSTGLIITDKIPDKATDRKFVEAQNIKSLKLRRRGSVLKGTLYGMATGFAIGAASTSIDAEDSWLMSRENMIIAGGIFVGILGGGTGALIGTSSKRFEINGKVAMYHLKIPFLRKMVYGIDPKVSQEKSLTYE